MLRQKLPFPVVADDYVDPKLGTGAVKITPGHDQNDFEIGKRHKLPVINILSEDGKIHLSNTTLWTEAIMKMKDKLVVGDQAIEMAKAQK